MNQAAPLKFGMGASPRRIEDGSLIRGRGRYTTDVKPDGTLTAYVLRSAAGHARVRIGDLSAARGAPGAGGGLVTRVFDLTDVIGPDDFDKVYRLVGAILDESESLALDDGNDRETLKRRLWVALGTVPDQEWLDDPVTARLWRAWLKTQPEEKAQRLAAGVEVES